MLTNRELLAVDQASTNNRQLFDRDDTVAWMADVPNSLDKYVALFNIRDQSAQVTCKLAEVGFTGPCQGHDLWRGRDVGTVTNELSAQLLPHGAAIFRLAPTHPTLLSSIVFV